MNTQRIEQLKSFLKDDPHDAFSKYALALEYQDEDPETCLSYFRDLLSNHPNYIGTYYHAAGLLADLGIRDEAEQVYQEGIKRAKEAQDHHALRELETAYMNFQFEE